MKNLFFYGMMVRLANEDDRQEASLFLDLWKKFFIQSLPDGWKYPDFPDGSPGTEEYAIQKISRVKNEDPDPALCWPSYEAIKMSFEFNGDPELMPKEYKLK